MIKLKQDLLKFNLCDHCLGRQFSLMFKDYNPEKIGAALRKASSVEEVEKLLNQDLEVLELKDCWLCADTFTKIDFFKKKLLKKANEIEFSCFLIGSKLPFSILEKEDVLWSKVHSEYCEPIKREINVIFGTFLNETTSKKVEFKHPDVVFLIDFEKQDIGVQINSLFIYGRYNKFERGLPQTKWPCRMCSGTGKYQGEICPNCNGTGKQYQETIEELIAKKAVEKTQAEDESFHGSGREDRDALMLGNGRPFVLELKRPKKRFINFKELEKEINDYSNGKVKVSELRESTKQEVVDLKKAEHDKLYGSIVKCEKPYEQLNKLDKFFNNKVLLQRTPTRVAHRRKDKIRKRKVYFVETQPIDKLSFKAKIKAESGTYIKELISGDFGRTKPSFSEVLKVPCVCEQLDVLEVIESK